MRQWEDIVEVALPLPFALRIIKAYVIFGSDGITIVDTGLHTAEDIRTWEQAQQEGDWKWSDVKRIVLTHYHPDHYGLAGTLQRWTEAPVYASALDIEQAQLFFSRDSDMPNKMAHFFCKHGLDKELVEKIPSHLKSYHSWVEPHPIPTIIHAGDTIRLGDREYVVYHTPGHADGHLSYFDAERGWLLGGDFLLPRISPNISLWPGCHSNPLEVYLHTLEKMKELPVKKVFPSHGAVFDHYEQRIEELKIHHRDRLESIKQHLVNMGQETAYGVCGYLFGRDLSMHNLRFALSETLSHLEYLRLRGEVTMIEEGDRYFYEA